MGKNKRKAFTLAEVLITLGIIGVVAALTIPTLINNYQKKEAVAKLQRAISVLNNTHKLMMVDEGVEKFDQTKVMTECANLQDEAEASNCVCNYYSKYLKISSCSKEFINEDFYPLSKLTYLDGTPETESGKYLLASPMFQTQDGILYSLFGFYQFIDINGKIPPNQYGRDILGLLCYRDNFGGVADSCTVFGEEYWDDATYVSARNYCGDDKSFTRGGLMCSGRIKAEGWKINY